MKLYNNYIGIDIGKLTFVVATHGSNKTQEYDNDSLGIETFLKDYKKIIKDSLCILETTGGYEMRLLLTLCELGISVHRANTRKVKRFIQSYGNEAKTDKLDAKSLARYGYERCNSLTIFSPQSKQSLVLYELVQRRNDLKQMIVAEKNRLQAPRAERIQKSCQIILDALNQQSKEVTKEINLLIEQDPILKAKKIILKTIPGIGEVIANELLILVPELGSLTRRQIASLVGLAPRANDSGQFSGYRSVNHGRKGIKPSLFLAAMAARNSNSSLKMFYNTLVANGKKKMVALTALMRKIIVIANARIRDLNLELAAI